MSFKITEQRVVLTARPFVVEELSVAIDDHPVTDPYHRLVCPDWVNVLPVTRDRQVVMIRQFRMGAQSDILEIPGGQLDAHEKDPTLAAARELEEETGYASTRMIGIGSVNPNPAIQSNRCHFFLALDCVVKGSERQHFPDDNERIEIVLTPLEELEQAVRFGQIDHGLACLNIMLALKHPALGIL